MRASDPFQVVSFRKFVLDVLERIDERSSKGRKAEGQANVSVFARRSEELERRVLGRLSFGGHRSRERCIEFIDQRRRENMMLTNGQELIVRKIVCRPKSQARGRGPGSEIGLIPSE